MANDLHVLVPRLVASGMLALRQVAVMPLLVNRGYDNMAGERGSSIDIPISSAMSATDVAPANVPPATPDTAPTLVTIPLDQWKEARFYLTDKDEDEIMDGIMPMQASEAIKALANVVNNYIFALYKGFYGFTGTPGTTPFATDTTDVTRAGLVLNNQLAPIDDRHMMLDPFAQANALNLRAFQDSSWASSPAVITDAQINRKLGFDWWMSQLVPTHTKGTATGITLTSTSLVGDATVGLKASGAGTLVVGDILTIAGDAQTYVVTALANLTSSQATVSIKPTLRVANDGSGTPVAVTLKGSHTVNLAFHRDAIAFATRPLKNVEAGLGAVTSTAADPMSKLTLRLEVRREHKRTTWSFDILYGGVVARPELGCRLAG